MRDRIIQWVRGVKAPLTVYVATEGMVVCLPANSRGDWEDLGARSCKRDADVVMLNKAHFTILESEGFIDDIQDLGEGRRERCADGGCVQANERS